MIVAIDGPSGAGKSTVAKAVARKLGFSCLDTGAMYRAIAWKALEEGTILRMRRRSGNWLVRARSLSNTRQRPYSASRVHRWHGCDLCHPHAEIDKAVSPVSATPSVREALVAQQQRIGASGNYVVEGRDIGTTVFPDAACKVFLTASAEERAHRRVRQNVDRDLGSIDYEEVLADIIRRDEVDSSRSVSPLKPAEDALHIDSTNCYIEEIIDQICALAQRAQE